MERGQRWWLPVPRALGPVTMAHSAASLPGEAVVRPRGRRQLRPRSCERAPTRCSRLPGRQQDLDDSRRGPGGHRRGDTGQRTVDAGRLRRGEDHLGDAIAPTIASASSLPAFEVQAGATVVLADCDLRGPDQPTAGTAIVAEGAIVAGTLHAARCSFQAGSFSSAPGCSGAGVQVNQGHFAADSCAFRGGGDLPAGRGLGRHAGARVVARDPYVLAVVR